MITVELLAEVNTFGKNETLRSWIQARRTRRSQRRSLRLFIHYKPFTSVNRRYKSDRNI